MAAPPDAVGLVATFGGAVEPSVHAPDTVHAAREGGIGVVDDAILEHERAHARPIANKGGRVGSAHGRELSPGLLAATLLTRPALKRRLPPIVVFDVAFALLLLAEPNVEVGIEVAAGR